MNDEGKDVWSRNSRTRREEMWEAAEPRWPESGLNTINLLQNFTPRSNRSHMRTKERENGSREEGGEGGEMGGYERDGEGKGVGRRQRGERFLRNV